jgi:hypothetical protein
MDVRTGRPPDFQGTGPGQSNGKDYGEHRESEERGYHDEARDHQDTRALESGDRDRIRGECLGKLNAMKELRAPYIYMSDHSIPPSVSVSDYEYMLELFWMNCRYD